MSGRDFQFPDNGFEAWGGYMQAKIAKLEEQFSSITSKQEKQISNIFNGISIYVNGYTIPSADELKELMALHGGVYHTYQRNDDFIIASNLPDTKVKNMNLAKVVRPEWISDSIMSKRLLNYTDYLLYGQSKTQPRIQFKNCIKNDTLVEKCLNVKVNVNLLSNESPKLALPALKPECNLGTIKCDSPSTPSSNKFITNKTELCKSAADSNFITEFYNNSRLHHISQLGACFKQYINDLRDTGTIDFPARINLKQRILSNNFSNDTIRNFEYGTTIMHIDMDCFFVSVGIRTKPELTGKPVAVTHSKGGLPKSTRAGVDRQTEFNLYKQKQVQRNQAVTGDLNSKHEVKFESRVDEIANEGDKFGSMSEIASCSYEARAKGIKNGMFMGAALKLCPDLQTIPYDFEGYKEVAYTLYNILAKYTLDIEAVSCDEMYVDCTELLNTLQVKVVDFASELRKEIKEATECSCSTGFGSNRLQARLATKKAKPDGQFFLSSNLVNEFMYNIKLKDLPGVGRQTAYKLESLGHQTCGSLQSLDLKFLQHHLGNKTGAHLFDQCRGVDSSLLTLYTVRKSVSAEVNYGIRFENINQCDDFLCKLSNEVQSRMQQFKVMGKCITLKLMVRAENAPIETAKYMGHGFCDVINKSTTLISATNDAKIITREVISICKKLNINPTEMRGVGIQMTKLESIGKQFKGGLNKYLTSKALNTDNITKTQQSLVDNQLVQDLKLENYIKPLRTLNIHEQNKSPLKKSPIIGQVKSSPGKKRGRPARNMKPVYNPSKNLLTKFLQVQAVTKEIPKQKIVSIKEHNFMKTGEQKPESLLDLPWNKIRELLRAWFNSGQVPKSCDIDLITTYLCEMVVQKNIDKLLILLNFMRRRIFELNSSMWSDVGYYVIEQVQNFMLTVYGKRLLLCDY